MAGRDGDGRELPDPFLFPFSFHLNTSMHPLIRYLERVRHGAGRGLGDSGNGCQGEERTMAATMACETNVVDSSSFSGIAETAVLNTGWLSFSGTAETAVSNTVRDEEWA